MALASVTVVRPPVMVVYSIVCEKAVIIHWKKKLSLKEKVDVKSRIVIHA